MVDTHSIFFRYLGVSRKEMDSYGPLWKVSGGERGIRTPDRAFDPITV